MDFICTDILNIVYPRTCEYLLYSFHSHAAMLSYWSVEHYCACISFYYNYNKRHYLEFELYLKLIYA